MGPGATSLWGLWAGRLTFDLRLPKTKPQKSDERSYSGQCLPVNGRRLSIGLLFQLTERTRPANDGFCCGGEGRAVSPSKLARGVSG